MSQYIGENMKDKEIPTSVRNQTESRFEDINLILNSCIPVSAMIAIKNLSSDLRAEVDTRRNISHKEHEYLIN